MEVIKERLRKQGATPRALYKPNWKTFGDGLAKDISLSYILKEHPHARADSKKAGGGEPAMWRQGLRVCKWTRVHEKDRREDDTRALIEELIGN